MRAIYKRELRSYFNSMVGYVFVAALIFFVGIFFLANNLFSGYPKFSVTLGGVLLILIICVSILTMKCMAEERRSRTDQMLLTYPVSLAGVVVGKYLAMVTVFAIPMALFCLCPLIIEAAGTAYLLQDYACILAFFLIGCAFIAVGMFISSLTESQIISAVGTFAALLILYFWSSLASFLPESIGSLMETFSFVDAFYNFTDLDVFDVSALVLYLSVIVLFVFLTVQMLRRKRGANTAVMSVVVLAIVVVVNLIMGQVPTNYKELDMSDNKLYTISDEALTYLDELDQQVEIIVFATEEDMEDIAAFLGQIEGVETSVTIREQTGGRCKLSVRTSGGLDANRVCSLLGGGGHAAAAGCTVAGTLEEAEAAVLAAIRQVEGHA